MTELLLLYAEMFARFFCVGLFAVGGGLATLPFLADMGDVTGWFSSADISNMVAISESTPGPLGINMATYIGFQVAGDYGMLWSVLGSVVASLGVVTPSVIIILIVSKILNRFKDSKYVKYAFYGLRAASLALVTSALLSVAKIAFFGVDTVLTADNILSALNLPVVILSIFIFLLAYKVKKIHPIMLIVFAAVTGIIFKF